VKQQKDSAQDIVLGESFNITIFLYTPPAANLLSLALSPEDSDFRVKMYFQKS
jgi:hypothetical protein